MVFEHSSNVVAASTQILTTTASNMHTAAPINNSEQCPQKRVYFPALDLEEVDWRMERSWELWRQQKKERKLCKMMAA